VQINQLKRKYDALVQSHSELKYEHQELREKVLLISAKVPESERGDEEQVGNAG
jgi:hypothetical protein